MDISFMDFLAGLGVLIVYIAPIIWLYNKTKDNYYKGI